MARKKTRALTVKVENNLIEAEWKFFTLNQKKIFWYISARMQELGYTLDSFRAKEVLMPEKTQVLDLETGELTEEETSKCFTMKLDTRKLFLDKRDALEALYKLQETRLIYKDEKKTVSVSAIPQVSRDNSKPHLITISMYAELFRFLLELQKYTTMQLNKIMDLNSKYSLRMYEKLNQVKNQNWPEFKLIGIDEANRFFDTKYKRLKDIERYILKPAKKELDEKSYISFEYLPIYDTNSKKKGRKPLIGYKFFVKKNTPQPTLF